MSFKCIRIYKSSIWSYEEEAKVYISLIFFIFQKEDELASVSFPSK